MSRPRLLTDPAEVEASDEFKRCLTLSKKSQEAVAAEIGEGVSQGTVWQWANRRLAIPANRARDAAAAVKADPSRISVAFRELNLAPRFLESVEPVEPSSHRVGIPLSTIADAMAVVRAYLQDKGEPLSRASEPMLIKIGLDIVIEADIPVSVDNVITFKQRFADRVSEDVDGNNGRKTAGTG